MGRNEVERSGGRRVQWRLNRRKGIWSQLFSLEPSNIEDMVATRGLEMSLGRERANIKMMTLRD